ncbi:MAG: thioredoxin-disulfide reductase [Lachnospiraceae bacterium]
MTDIIIIIGAGTAGLTSAIYALRAGKNVLVLEEKMYGGQIINTPDIENYPGFKNISGYEFATNLYNQAKELGMIYKNEKVLEIQEDSNGTKTVVTDKETYTAKAVIIASGAKNRPLGIDREQEFTGKGVSYCATCDGAFFRGRDVAVVGGGNTALEDSLFLSSYCNTVYVIHRRDEFRGDVREVEKLKAKDNVKLIMDSQVTDIIGEDMVSGIKVKNLKGGEEREIKVNGLFIAIGQMPDNERFKNLVDLDEKGYIIAGEDCRTSTAGIFAAGDCRTKNVRQLVTAAGDGAVAALAACSIS